MSQSDCALVERLDQKLSQLVLQIEKSEFYEVLSSPETSLPLLSALVRSVLLEVFSYGPHVTEATFTAVGRMPKNRPELMKSAILHDLEEVDHGEMALRDFVELGGDEKWARERRMTPASFAMAATCRMLSEYEDPFAYLGYMYLFEALTPEMTGRAQKFLAAKGFPIQAQKFIDTHAEEDIAHIAHTKWLAGLITKVARDYPEAEAAIEYGFDCFAAVYPLPIWAAALVHARANVGAR